jgi:uncharacterized protein (DUF362 family)/Pyruvate/2-oxoacid:ferredoxin oxidoreductase delta subunit
MLMKARVAIRTANDYSPQVLSDSIEKLLADLGGMKAFVKPGDRVLLKPNLLKSAAPEEAVVTHPALVEVVASMVLDCGATCCLGDSPPLGNLSKVLSKSGYDDFMKRLNVQAVPFHEKLPVDFPEGRLFRRIDLARELFDFDSVINLPKLKTHTQMGLTLAVKNLFGTVIGSDKAGWHLRAGRDYDTFATVLVQIYDKVRPRLSLIDGILGMEGNGPNSGNPRQVGLIAASTDAVALDAVVTRLIGFPFQSVRTTVLAHSMGVGIGDEAEIEVLGESLNGFPLRDFKAPRSISMTWNLSYWNPIRRFMENHVITKPAIDAAVCRSCGICLNHCPPQAISEANGKMVIDRRKCISCFCCHELCTNDAIEIVEPFWGRFFSSLSR